MIPVPLKFEHFKSKDGMFSVHWGLCSLCTFVSVGSGFMDLIVGGGGGGDNRAEHLAFVAFCPTTVQM